MKYQPETPFDSIENAQEYLRLLSDAIKEAQEGVEADILGTGTASHERRQQAMQLVKCKLGSLSTHIATSRRILNDLRTLRRLLMEQREARRAPGINAK